MSEFIDNTEQSPRVRDLFEFVGRVHGGEDVDVIAPEYENAIESIKPYDVLVIEDSMLREGVPIAEIKERIEPILGTFRPALEANDWDRPDEGHPIDNMMRENKEIASHLTELERLVDEIRQADSPPLSAVSDVQQHVAALQDVDVHFVRKENELFPYLEDHWKHDRPLGVMWSLHDDIRSLLSTLESMVTDPEADPQELAEQISRLSKLLRGLIFKEEYIIFPVAMSTLTDDEWETIQRECGEIGYFEIEPAFAFVELDSDGGGGEIADDKSNRDTAVPGISAGTVALGLETGSVTLDEIELLFDTLPVDVTYVDENDRVRYFNNPDDRIFPRSRSIIGRTVQNCHPPESVDRVEEVLSAFRSGEKDQARFWIQNDDAFIVIQYYALRDDSGQYRGTLEVSQEVSDIRDLEGEKRLVDWEE